MRSSAKGHERRFRDVRDESGLPPTPERLRRCSEPTLRAKGGCEQLQQGSGYSITSWALPELFLFAYAGGAQWKCERTSKIIIISEHIAARLAEQTLSES
jgi:hypothetical protein